MKTNKLTHSLAQAALRFIRAVAVGVIISDVLAFVAVSVYMFDGAQPHSVAPLLVIPIMAVFAAALVIAAIADEQIDCPAAH